LPSASIGNTIQCPYDNGWDTGLYAYSPCYRGESNSAAVTEKIKVLTEYVVKPFEKAKGETDILKQNNDSFWDSYMVELWAGKYFHTNNPEDMLQLYIAMMAGELAPEGDDGNPKYDQAAFVIVDKEKEQSLTKRAATTNIDAIGQFFMLLSENPQKLKNALKYVGVANLTEKADDATMKTLFYTWIGRDTRNAEIFAKIIEDAENKQFDEVLSVHAAIKDLAIRGKLNKNSVGDYTYNGVPLGKDLKTVAKRLVQDHEISDIKALILEE